MNGRATAEYPATLVHLIYMCREALKIEAQHNERYSYSVTCKMSGKVFCSLAKADVSSLRFTLSVYSVRFNIMWWNFLTII